MRCKSLELNEKKMLVLEISPWYWLCIAATERLTSERLSECH